jgi:hypothetical protein
LLCVEKSAILIAMNKLEKEIVDLAKKTEDLFRSSIITKADTKEIEKIRREFKCESEETMHEVYLEIKKRYIQAEYDYLKSKHGYAD